MKVVQFPTFRVVGEARMHHFSLQYNRSMLGICSVVGERSMSLGMDSKVIDDGSTSY